jgi:hypothetical protein
MTQHNDFIPDIVGYGGLEHLREEPVRRTIARKWCNFAVIPARLGETSYKDMDVDLVPGIVFTGLKTKQISYLCKLGYLRDRSLFEEYSGELGFNLLIREYLHPDGLPPSLYEFEVVKLPPVLQ